MPTHDAILAAARKIADPALVVYAVNTPRRSKAEMEALAQIPDIQSRELTAGKLAVHEEYPMLVAEALQAFLSESR